MKSDGYKSEGDYHTHNQPSTSRTTSPRSLPTDRPVSYSFRAALQGIQGTFPSSVTHLTLLGYILVMDEWLQLMQLLPALQHLDIHITSIPSGDNTASPTGDTTALHQEQIPTHQDQAVQEIDEMAISFSHITLYRTSRSASAKSRSPNGQSGKDENGNGCHDDKCVDTSIANHDRASDVLVPGNVTSALDQWRYRHSRDRVQDHVADEGKSEGGESSHDAQMAMELDENMLCHNFSQLQREGCFQFTSVRSLVFRGQIVSAEILAYLPRLENLSFSPVTVIPEAYSPSPYSYSSRSISGPVGVAATLMNKCPHVTHLALNESSIIASRTCSGWARHLSLLMCSMPGLEHFMTSIPIMATHGSEVVSALLEHHSQRLKSFRVIVPPSTGTHRYSKQRSGSKRRLSDTSFESTAEDNTNYPPSVSSVSTTTRLTKQECLRVLESCPKLETYESRVDLSMQDVIASVPKWPCHDSIKVLTLEIQELFNDCSMEEVATMDMFIKTLLHCSRPSSPTEESKEKQPSISESDTFSSPFSSIPSTSSTDAFMSMSSALDSGYAIPSASSSLSAPKQQPHSTLRQSEPIVANSFTTSPPSETLPSSTYFPSPHHVEASYKRRNKDMETSSDRGDAPKSHVLEQHDPPPLPTTFPDRSRVKYPVLAVGRLVALQYLVEKQLSKLASLDRFSLGQTVYLMPRA